MTVIPIAPPNPISFNQLFAKAILETENQSTELASQFPEICRDAELSLLRDLDIQNLNVYADTNFNSPGMLIPIPNSTQTRPLTVGETAYVPLPNDCEVMRYVIWFTPVGGTPSQDDITDQYSGAANSLLRVDETYLQAYWPNKSVTDPNGPAIYCVLGTARAQSFPPGQILVAPTPAQNYAMRIGYTTRPTSLVDVDQTTGATYLSTWYPDVLFYACMVRCGAFMKSLQQLQLWMALFQGALGNAQKLEARKKGQSYADTSVTTIPLQTRSQ